MWWSSSIPYLNAAHSDTHQRSWGRWVMCYLKADSDKWQRRFVWQKEVHFNSWRIQGNRERGRRKISFVNVECKQETGFCYQQCSGFSIQSWAGFSRMTVSAYSLCVDQQTEHIGLNTVLSDVELTFFKLCKLAFCRMTPFFRLKLLTRL